MGQFWYFGGTGDYYGQVNSKVISNQAITFVFNFRSARLSDASWFVKMI